MLHKKKILGVGITADSKNKILEYVLQIVWGGDQKLFIATPNPEILVYAQKHLAYKDKLNSADIALPDGVGLMFASRLMRKGIHERIPGVDFIEELCKAARKKPLSIGLLGGRGGVAELAAECLKQKYPWIKVVFVGEEWLGDSGFKIKDLRFKKREILNPKSYFLNPPQIDILFVAYGFPKQEEWIYENLEKLPVKAAMGVGGAFDYLSGKVHRAPGVFRAMGLEWLFRLMTQPWRIKRQLALVEFLILIGKEMVIGRPMK